VLGRRRDRGLSAARATTRRARTRRKRISRPEDGAKDDKTGAQVADGAPTGVVFYTPPDIGRQHGDRRRQADLLKLKLHLRAARPLTPADTIDENMPRLQDMFQTFLRELRPEDLSGSQGS